MISIIFCGSVSKKYKSSSCDKITVIMLGCQVKENQPCNMLKRRIKCAADILSSNSHTVCVVAGGIGKGANISEADASKNILVTKYHINPDRIFTESESQNTNQNFMFSKEVIKSHNLPESIIVVSNSFHVYRGMLYAKKHGFKHIWCKYPPFKVSELFFWLREIPALLKLWLNL